MSLRTILKADEIRADVNLEGDKSIVLNGSGNLTMAARDVFENLDITADNNYEAVRIIQEGSGDGLSVVTSNGLADGTAIEQLRLNATGDLTLRSLNSGGLVYTDTLGKLTNTKPAGINVVTSVNTLSGAVTLTAATVGALDVNNNLSDLDNASVARVNLGLGTAAVIDANSKADLINGKIPVNQIPSMAVTEFLGVVGSEAEMLTLRGEKGDFTTRSDLSTNWIIVNNDGSSISDWIQLSYPAAGVTSFNGQTGAVTLTSLSELTNDTNFVTQTELDVVDDKTAVLATQMTDLEALVFANL